MLTDSLWLLVWDDCPTVTHVTPAIFVLVVDQIILLKALAVKTWRTQFKQDER